jgi:hypothetical protein
MERAAGLAAARSISRELYYHRGTIGVKGFEWGGSEGLGGASCIRTVSCSISRQGPSTARADAFAGANAKKRRWLASVGMTSRDGRAELRSLALGDFEFVIVAMPWRLSDPNLRWC